MPYIGTSPSNGVRRVFDYTATAGQTSFSGSDNNSQTLAYTDSAYIDVYQNGILLVPSDYTATTGTTVVLDTGATVSDTVQIVAYDVFSVADTVSASDGGSFGGNLGVGGTLSVTGVPTFTGRSVHSGGITVANDGQIGSVGDADAMAISSSGVVTFSQTPVGAGNVMIKLASTTISSAVAQIAFDSSIITSTYDTYHVIFSNISTTTAQDDIGMRASVDNGSTIINSVSNHHYSLLNGTDSSRAYNKNYHVIAEDTEEDATQEAGTSGMFTIFRANSSSHYKQVIGWGITENSGTNGNYYGYRGYTVIPTSSALNYIKIFSVQGNNLDSGKATVYGVIT